MTKKYTRLVSNTSISENYIGNITEKIDKFLIKAKKKEMEEKFK